jgi:hypothetical protein
MVWYYGFVSRSHLALSEPMEDSQMALYGAPLRLMRAVFMSVVGVTIGSVEWTATIQ